MEEWKGRLRGAISLRMGGGGGGHDWDGGVGSGSFTEGYYVCL